MYFLRKCLWQLRSACLSVSLLAIPSILCMKPIHALFGPKCQSCTYFTSYQHCIYVISANIYPFFIEKYSKWLAYCSVKNSNLFSYRKKISSKNVISQTKDLKGNWWSTNAPQHLMLLWYIHIHSLLTLSNGPEAFILPC